MNRIIRSLRIPLWLLGVLWGYLLTFSGEAWKKLRQFVKSYLSVAVILGAAVLIVPPVTQYWLSHVHIPPVPISAIVAMFAASLMLLAFGAVMYVVLNLLIQIAGAERNIWPVAVQQQRIAKQQQSQPYSEGAFIPHTDEQAWAQERFDVLQKKGILTKDDVDKVEELAQEMGLAALQRERERPKK